MAEESTKISVYYGYSDDINILLGEYTKSSGGSSSGSSGGSSSGDSQYHGGLYKATSDYMMYNDGYYVVIGTLTFNSSVKSQQVKFVTPFTANNYNVVFDGSLLSSYISVTSKYTTNFIAYCSYPAFSSSSTASITVNYTATGYWKV